jgi:hypothetical protein
LSSKGSELAIIILKNYLLSCAVPHNQDLQLIALICLSLSTKVYSFLISQVEE